MLTTIGRAVRLLDPRGRRQLLVVLALMILTAVFEALGVGSIIPFITVLARPEAADTTPALVALRAALGVAPGRPFLLALGIMACGVFVLTILANITLAYVLQRFTWSKGQNLAERLFAATLAQPYRAFLGQHTGALQALIFTEAQRVTSNAIYPSLVIVARGMAALAIIALILIYDPWVAITLGLMVTLSYGAIYLVLRARVIRWGEGAVAARAGAQTLAAEAFSGFRAIRMAGQEAAYTTRMHAATRAIAHNEASGLFAAMLPRFAVELVAFGTLFVLLLARLATGSDVADVLPVAGAFAIAASRLLPAAQQVYWAATTLKGAGAALDAVETGLAAPADPAAPPHAPWPGDGLIRLEAVSYHYAAGGTHAVGPLTLGIAPGERIALVGPTGSGKSTVLGLLTGLLAPTSGEIDVDGVRLEGERRRRWAMTLGLVEQETFLAKASVTDNVAFGLPADTARIIAALAAAQVMPEIAALPAGLDTVIGEGGHGLSGGQRQRIGLARALYRQPKLLVLDEPTSALDSATEDAVLTVLRSLPKSQTIVFVTHRPALLALATRTLRLVDGAVVSSGSPSMPAVPDRAARA
jgi:ABC-type multidrug transport system fused ATPase/permease subunit